MRLSSLKSRTSLSCKSSMQGYFLNLDWTVLVLSVHNKFDVCGLLATVYAIFPHVLTKIVHMITVPD